MANLDNNDVVEVTFEGKVFGQQTISTFFYKVNGVTVGIPIFTELSNFIGKIRAPGKLFQKYQNVTTDGLEDLNVYAQVVYPIRYRYTNDGELTQTGAVEEETMPPNVQASITRVAERAGQRYTSHLAVPAVPRTASIAGLLLTGYMTDLQALADEVIATIVLDSGVEMTPCIFHPQYTPVYEPLFLAFPQETIRVMRRRTVGLGS